MRGLPKVDGYNLVRALADTLGCRLGRSVPRNASTMVFGAWQGRQYADNPKYLIEYLAAADPSLDLVWIGDESVRTQIPDVPNIRFVPYGSPSAWLACLRAAALFATHSHHDLNPVNLSGGARSFYLGHGLAIKNMGAGQLEHGDRPFIAALRTMWRRRVRFDYWLASSEVHRDKLVAENQRALISSSEVLPLGQPRLDLLFASRRDPSIRESIRRDLRDGCGLPADATLVTYLPTFRDSGAAPFSFGDLNEADMAAVADAFGDTDVWIGEKAHAADSTTSGASGRDVPWLLDLRTAPQLDTQELLIASDIVITDYSGCYVDFLVLDRPIIHFAYDLESYKHADRGLYFELEDVAGGPIVESLDALVAALADAITDPARGSERRQHLAQRLLGYEDGTSSRRIANGLGIG